MAENTDEPKKDEEQLPRERESRDERSTGSVSQPGLDAPSDCAGSGDSEGTHAGTPENESVTERLDPLQGTPAAAGEPPIGPPVVGGGGPSETLPVRYSGLRGGHYDHAEWDDELGDYVLAQPSSQVLVGTCLKHAPHRTRQGWQPSYAREPPGWNRTKHGMASRVMVELRRVWYAVPPTVAMRTIPWQAVVVLWGCHWDHLLNRERWEARIRRWADLPPVMRNVRLWTYNELVGRITPGYLADRAWDGRLKGALWQTEAGVWARVKAFQRMIEARRRVELAAGSA